MYIEDLVKEATEINMKNEALQKLWPQMFIELVRDESCFRHGLVLTGWGGWGRKI